MAYEALQRPSLRVPEGRAVPNALAAALAAVETLENCPLFNAGKGAVLNARGFVENEASVMDGLSMRSGAVCGRKLQTKSDSHI